jgi:hypothetical protein
MRDRLLEPDYQFQMRRLDRDIKVKSAAESKELTRNITVVSELKPERNHPNGTRIIGT